MIDYFFSFIRNEKKNRTNPVKSDTDGDGITDYDELFRNMYVGQEGEVYYHDDFEGYNYITNFQTMASIADMSTGHVQQQSGELYEDDDPVNSLTDFYVRTDQPKFVVLLIVKRN